MLRKLLRLLLLPLLGLLVLGAAAIHLIATGVGGELHGRGAISPLPVPVPEVAVRSTAARFAGAPQHETSQILFGDLHVHTSWSGDAFVFSLPLFQGEGAHPPADACDFARHCAQLDFWSINDHAESLTPRQWRETREAVRECNAVAADPLNPDLVTYLGWEWTQSAPAGADSVRDPDLVHYGHKNVILRDTADDAVPSRPISAGEGGLFAGSTPPGFWSAVRFAMTLRDWPDVEPYLDFNAFAAEVGGHAACAEGVPVRDLPEDCLEGAATPRELFAKLADWGFPSLVIPHGTSWGIHAPPAAALSDQLSQTQHDPGRQRLFEVYSGHGTSERWFDFRDAREAEDGSLECAAPDAGFEPCCWRAGEIIRERCLAEGSAPHVCAERADETRRLALAATTPYAVVGATTADDWLECGQPPADFLPAYQYRPDMSAQFGLALRADNGATFRYGLIASSDNHKARAGPGYKEVGRTAFGDAYGLRADWHEALWPDAPPSSQPVRDAGPLAGLMVGFERGASFYYTGGLVAVHSAGRDRESIWRALEARRAYATSGPRILLWFDLLNGPDGPTPMGGEAELAGERPQFRVRAAGALEQQPGCPASALAALGADRLERLCLGECHHPGDSRHPITRIEVVRIRKQLSSDEPIAKLIEDPWRVLPCAQDRDGCVVEFSGELPEPGRETVYYVRALQAPTPAVNGDPMRCTRDARGACLEADSCPASGPRSDPSDDCLSAVEERAWSSPIFVRS